jgi:hypothetical protein
MWRYAAAVAVGLVLGWVVGVNQITLIARAGNVSGAFRLVENVERTVNFYAERGHKGW